MLLRDLQIIWRLANVKPARLRYTASERLSHGGCGLSDRGIVVLALHIVTSISNFDRLNAGGNR